MSTENKIPDIDLPIKEDGTIDYDFLNKRHAESVKRTYRSQLEPIYDPNTGKKIGDKIIIIPPEE